MRHLHVWGCSAEVRVCNPHEKKLDARTISGFFIGYSDKSKGYKFYCPNHSTRIIESGNARFIENGKISGSLEPRNVDINEILPGSSIVDSLIVSQPNNMKDQLVSLQNLPSQINADESITQVREDASISHEKALRRSTRVTRPALSDDYLAYSIQHECDISIDKNPDTFKQAMKCDN